VLSHWVGERMPLELEGKTFVVTGATDGIGQQTLRDVQKFLMNIEKSL
jgi:short-subunit dehydrogenase